MRSFNLQDLNTEHSRFDSPVMGFNIYVHLHGSFPKYKSWMLPNINYNKTYSYLLSKYQHSICHDKSIILTQFNSQADICMLCLKPDLFVYYRVYTETTIDIMTFIYNPSLEEEVSLLWGALQEFKVITPKEPVCNIICMRDGDFHLKEFKVKKLDVNLSLNYDSSLIPKDNIIKSKLLEKESSGVTLLHGAPGTGKTSYIRHLIGYFSEHKKVLYVSPNIVSNLASPAFSEFMMDNRDSILVVEDAEEILVARNSGRNSGIQTLLNLSDGLLGDAMATQIICSFNTNSTNIDPALRRRGRIICEHEFKALDISQAQKVSDSLGFTNTITTSMTLAEIYNQNSMDFNHKQSKVGFIK